LGVHAILWLVFGWRLNFTRNCLGFSVLSPQCINFGYLAIDILRLYSKMEYSNH
jgi:hypothetical protein